MIKRTCLIFLILVGYSTTAQDIIWEGEVSLTGQFSNEDVTPFWFHRNTHGQFDGETSFSGFGSVSGTYALSDNASIEARGSLFYRNEVLDEMQRRDLYVNFKNKWLKATVGSKIIEEQVMGLSATNKNILYSGNARPLPGVLLEANEPFTLFKNFSLDWGIGHYQLYDDRYVDDVRVHYKRLGLIAAFNNQSVLTARIQHFAQWAGTSADFGGLPNDFNAFLDVFIAKQAAETNTDGEIQNAVGNHLGSYFLEYFFKTDIGDFSVWHEHLFEDGSGTRFANFPDGVWGVHYQSTNKRFISGVLYEYIHTNDQGVGNQLAGSDNYFSNTIYRSGWSYERRIIGLPFILIDPVVEITSATSPIISNRTKTHHFGIQGDIHKFSWVFKTSYASHLGTYNNPIPEISLWHNYLSVTYAMDKYGSFRIFTGLDSGDGIDTSFGAGLEYFYTFK